MPRRKFEPFPEEAAERVIRIMGESASVQTALDAYRERRAAGETEIGMWWDGQIILVGPDPGDLTLTELKGFQR